MKIAIVSPFEESVPPLKYGGTELVVNNLIDGLLRLRHDVTLLASGDSKTGAKLVPIFPRAIRRIPKFKDLKLRDSYKFIGVGKIINYLSKNKFDIIHNHIGWRILPFENLVTAPMVTTLHGPLDVFYQQEVYSAYGQSRYISISYNQRKPMPKLNYVANIYHGLELDKFKYFPQPKDYFAFLGRMSPEKGPVEAIQIAKKAGVKLVMAAKVDAVDVKYFKDQVEPLIDGEQIQFIGEVDHPGKVKLLGNAKALIAPIQWEEPFGLYLIEALACGTPVISMRRGSVPELIVDKKTGFICKSINEAAVKIKFISKISREDCYQYTLSHFSVERMAMDHLNLYAKILKEKK
jgi:glycosyltransferase involved in cell wall biosynthesis